MSVLHQPEKLDASRLPFKVNQGHQSRHGSNGFERDFLLALTFGLSSINQLLLTSKQYIHSINA